MSYEHIKTIILTILVATSALLTWNLWTYQPNFEPIEKANTVQEVTIAEKRSESDCKTGHPLIPSREKRPLEQSAPVKSII